MAFLIKNISFGVMSPDIQIFDRFVLTPKIDL